MLPGGLRELHQPGINACGGAWQRDRRLLAIEIRALAGCPTANGERLARAGSAQAWGLPFLYRRPPSFGGLWSPAGARYVFRQCFSPHLRYRTADRGLVWP